MLGRFALTLAVGTTIGVAVGLATGAEFWFSVLIGAGISVVFFAVTRGRNIFDGGGDGDSGDGGD